MLEFEVERAEGYGVDPELEKRYPQLARPSIRLLPRDAAAAPLVVAFSAFPGLHVRFGRWCMMAFPSCGCDACDETAEDEIEHLTSLIDDLAAGRFREVVRLNPNDDASGASEVWSAGERSTRQSVPARSKRRAAANCRRRSRGTRLEAMAAAELRG